MVHAGPVYIEPSLPMRQISRPKLYNSIITGNQKINNCASQLKNSLFL
jgi:hypothetical protein